MCGPFVHRIDPVFGEVAGFYLWFYGLSYSLGFLSIFWFKRMRHRFGLTIDAIYSLTIYLAIGRLVGGRLVVDGYGRGEALLSYFKTILARGWLRCL